LIVAEHLTDFGRPSQKSRVQTAADHAHALPEPKPFLKWVGGKRQLLPEIAKHLPESLGRYHEPFVGGGALFFHLKPKNAVLTDQNERLIRTYRGIRDDVEGVIRRLEGYRHTRRFYLEMRERPIDKKSDVEVAAWFVYLNRTGYNGLYRVNRQNRFNVPFGAYERPTICNPENLRACSRMLKGVTLETRDFASVLEHVKKNDFVYFDPPYVPLSATAKFTSYTTYGFSDVDQVRLRDVAVELKRRGAFVLISNSAARRVHELYASFRRVGVRARRSVNCHGDGRASVPELLIF
jgi:DNA adenine methylase